MSAADGLLAAIQAQRLAWDMTPEGASATTTDRLIMFAAQRLDGGWLAIIIVKRRHRDEMIGAAFMTRREVARHGAQRWCERVEADWHYGLATADEARDGDADKVVTR